MIEEEEGEEGEEEGNNMMCHAPSPSSACPPSAPVCGRGPERLCSDVLLSCGKSCVTKTSVKRRGKEEITG